MDIDFYTFLKDNPKTSTEQIDFFIELITNSQDKFLYLIEEPLQKNLESFLHIEYSSLIKEITILLREEINSFEQSLSQHEDSNLAMVLFR